MAEEILRLILQKLWQKKAIDSGEITVYSSKPIKAGNFVTPSKMEAKSYAGSGKIYEEKLNLNDISWIDAFKVK